MYSSGDDDTSDGFFDDYLLKGLCGSGPTTCRAFSIQDAINIGLTPKPKGHCWIYPLGFLTVPPCHPLRDQVQDLFLKFVNEGSHPFYRNQIFFEISPHKIHELKSIRFKSSSINIAEHLIRILESISMNILPQEVKLFVRICNNKKYHYNKCTLIGPLDAPPLGERAYDPSPVSTPGDLAALGFLSYLEPVPTEGFEDGSNNEDHGIVFDKIEPNIANNNNRGTYHDDNLGATLLRLRWHAEFNSNDAEFLGLHLQNESGDEQDRPCWIYGPGMIYVDGNHSDLKLVCGLLINWCVLVKDPTYVTQCVFQLSTEKLRASNQSTIVILNKEFLT